MAYTIAIKKANGSMVTAAYKTEGEALDMIDTINTLYKIVEMDWITKRNVVIVLGGKDGDEI